MNFFKKIRAGFSLVLGARPVTSSIHQCSEFMQHAHSLEDSLVLAKLFARAQSSVGLFIPQAVRSTLLLNLNGPEDSSRLEQSLQRAQASLRLLSAYHYHVGLSEPFGDFVIEQALALEKSLLPILNRPLRTAPDSISFPLVMAAQLDRIALSAAPVGLRALAQKLALHDALSPSLARELAERVRVMGRTGYALHYSAVQDHLKKIQPLQQKLTPDAFELQLDQIKKPLASKIGTPLEEAQIYYEAGLFDQALVPIKEVLALPTDKERRWAREELFKELTQPIRGNSRAFCAWAQHAFSSELLPQPPTVKLG